MNNEELEKIVRDFFAEYIATLKSPTEWFTLTTCGRHREKTIKVKCLLNSKLLPRYTIVSGRADNWETAQDNLLYEIQLIKDRYDNERKEKAKSKKKETIRG